VLKKKSILTFWLRKMLPLLVTRVRLKPRPKNNSIKSAIRVLNHFLILEQHREVKMSNNKKEKKLPSPKVLQKMANKKLE
jgi:hypothetical protein